MRMMRWEWRISDNFVLDEALKEIIMLVNNFRTARGIFCDGVLSRVSLEPVMKTCSKALIVETDQKRKNCR